MMCAKLLRHTPEERQTRFYRWSGRMFDRIIHRYGQMLTWVLDRQFATLMVAILTLIVTVVLYIAIPKGFFPVQDTGAIQGISEAPQTVSFAAMNAPMSPARFRISSPPFWFSLRPTRSSA